jgi:endoglucanase
MDRLTLLKELTEAFGISGFEDNIGRMMAGYFKKTAAVTRDHLGSVIARVTGKTERPKIMFAAHMDEIGFLVKSITKTGFIKFLPVGGWWAGNLPGQKVKVINRKGDQFVGMIGQKAIHEMREEETKKLPEIDDLFIDVGASAEFKVKERLQIRPGDPIVPEAKFEVMANSDLLLAKAWDDRMGCALLVELAGNIAALEHPNTVFLTATVQEEVGLRGARTAAYAVAPDVAFALDVGLSRDMPGYEEEYDERLGSGVAILIYDRTMIPHPRLKEFVIELAENNNIPFHLTSLKGGYDTGIIHLNQAGVPSLALGIPTRYIHGHLGIINVNDYEHLLNLITLIVKNLDEETLNSIQKGA